VGARYVELATTIHSAVAVVIGFALEQPFISHFVDPPPNPNRVCLRKGTLGPSLGARAFTGADLHKLLKAASQGRSVAIG
jgi:hypothetical protein